MPTLEQTRLSTLNNARYRKQNISQKLRGSLLQNNRPATEATDDQNQPESIHKTRLGLLKADAIKQANKQGGAAAGAAVGGSIGSIVPIIGTGIGAFIGRYVGKKLGITGIIIMAILMVMFFVGIFIAVLKGYCDSQGILKKLATEGAALVGVPGASSLISVCKALAS